MTRLALAVCLGVILFCCCFGCNKPTPPAQPTSDPPAQSEDDRALLVGINAYPDAPLRGCVNDVLDMKEYLVSEEGFPEGKIVLLTDAAATREAILEKLKWLVADAKAGDRRYFHFSGHGTEFAGRNLAQQPNGLNQVICPVDFAWVADKMIMDVDFVDVFKAMPPGVLFNWASDSCHSGDLTRTINKPGAKPRQWPNVPDDVKAQIRKAKEAQIKPRGFVGGLLDVGYVSGCRYDQTSADAFEGGKYCGAMTYFYLKVLRAKKGQPLTEVVKEMNAQLAASFYDQQPQAEGARASRPLLK